MKINQLMKTNAQHKIWYLRTRNSISFSFSTFRRSLSFWRQLEGSATLERRSSVPIQVEIGSYYKNIDFQLVINDSNKRAHLLCNYFSTLHRIFSSLYSHAKNWGTARDHLKRKVPTPGFSTCNAAHGLLLGRSIASVGHFFVIRMVAYWLR